MDEGTDKGTHLAVGEYRYFSPVELGFMTEAEYEEAKRWPKAKGRVIAVQDGEVTFELIADE